MSENVAFISVEGAKRLEKVAEWLERGAPHEVVDQSGTVIGGFDMDVGVKFGESDCGTACCIAGAVCQFNQPFAPEDRSDRYYTEIDFYYESEEGLIEGRNMMSTVMGRAEILLGISHEIGKQLFTPYGFGGETPAQAAQVIRNFLQTGVVDWEV